jgi:hypothetical protein
MPLKDRETAMPASDSVAIVDLDEYRRRRQARSAAAASSPTNGMQPVMWCFVWMMVPFGFPVGQLQA